MKPFTSSQQLLDSLCDSGLSNFQKVLSDQTS
jgi:hypothetical protein